MLQNRVLGGVNLKYVNTTVCAQNTYLKAFDKTNTITSYCAFNRHVL